MKPEHWHQVKELFARARELPERERAALLRESSAGDRELVDEVEALLDEAARLTRFLSTQALVESDDALARGRERIGSYTILGVLGRGGMGVVYLAEQESPRRTVALKVIGNALASPQAVRRFEHEARALARLQHPGIAQIFEAGVADDGRVPFYAMEHVEGVPLDQWARERQPSVNERLELFAKVCDAVQHAHQKGVIHRDLKPANVLVDTSGEPKVLDFGIARLDDDARTTTLRTGAGVLVGTLAYMSPEQVAGDPDDVDTQSDVYALGVVLYELLAGRLPHELARKSIPEAARAIRDEEPPPLSARDRALRGDLERIAAKALAKDRAQRYASASDLAADARRYLRDEPITARPPSALYQLSKFTRRNRALVVASALGVLALVGGLFGTSWQYVQATESAEGAQRRYEQVRELAHVFTHDVYDHIKNLPGATEARTFIVRTGLDYLDNLAREAGDDPELLEELAAGYRRISNVQGDPFTANLGDHEGAMQSAHKCVEYSRALVAIRPDDVDAQSLLSEGLASLGGLLAIQEELEEALEHWKASHEIEDELRRAHPEDRSVQRQWLSSSMRYAIGEYANGNGERALEILIGSLPLAQRIVAENADSFWERMHTVAVKSRIADIEDSLGHRDKALAAYEDVVSEVERAVEERPDDALLRADMNYSRFRLAELLSGASRYAEALAIASKAAESARQLVDADANNVKSRVDLGAALRAVGRVRRDTALSAGPDTTLAEWNAARAAFAESLQLLTALQEQGTLTMFDASDVDDIAREVEACDDAIGALESQ